MCAGTLVRIRVRRVEIEQFLQGGSEISERSEEKFFLLDPPKPPQMSMVRGGWGDWGVSLKNNYNII